MGNKPCELARASLPGPRGLSPPLPSHDPTLAGAVYISKEGHSLWRLFLYLLTLDRRISQDLGATQRSDLLRRNSGHGSLRKGTASAVRRPMFS